MNNKKILVLLKFFKGELNPFDASSLECALRLTNNVTILTMSPTAYLEPFKALTRLGANGVFITDKAYAGADTLATSKVLAKAIEKINPDYVFCGRQSIDGDTAQVPVQVAKRLNLNLITRAMKIENGVVKTRNGETELVEKSVITFERGYELRFPSIFSKLGNVETIDNSVLQIPLEECGQKGSPTKVIRSFESTVGRRFCSFTEFSNLEKLIEENLNKEKQEEEYLGEKLEKVFFVGSLSKKANAIANKAIEIKVNNKTAEEVAKEIVENNAKIVLFSDDEETKILASRIAVILNAGLCADCIKLRVENGKFIMTRPALSGSVTADIVCESEYTFATVRTTKKANDIIFSVGVGGLNYIDKIEELAKKYNAEICCTRSVVDMNKMPYERQVGLTGRIVAPKIYVAFGISGAVQHTCAIEGATTIIAVNNDKNARIFDYADYGILYTL